ncbi:membrane dipeptidase [Siminovitchia sp. FSL H7-0308]|uniref:dipeptidase n=1 Tax=Siminovitchia sp. FSL H7-0308 TaxID=2921432 RepID=UPI0030EF4E2F
MESDNQQLVIDGCMYPVGDFEGCSESVQKSKMNAFFLTLLSFEGFSETIRSIANIYNVVDQQEKTLGVARTYAELQKNAAAGKKSIILTFQEPYPIGNSLNNLRAFYEMGVRVVQLTYNKANYIGSGCTETIDRGLTDFGREMIHEMNRLGMLIDVSHSSKLTTLSAIQESESPVVFSHANVKKISHIPRNKTDEEIKLLAEKGGVMGLTPWAPLCWKGEINQQPTLDDYLDHVEYVIDLAGIDHVGYGSDAPPDDKIDTPGVLEQATLYPEVVGKYYSSVSEDFSLAHAKDFKGSKELDHVMMGLKKRGYSDDDVDKFIGGNFARVIKQVWK